MLSRILYFITGNSKKYLEETESDFPSKDISEPVISFINTLKAEPKRFKIVWVNKEEYINFTPSGRAYKKALYELIDKKSGEKFPFSQAGGGYWDMPDFLTYGEKKFVEKEVQTVFNQKTKLLYQLQRKRESRDYQKERDRLKEIYCGN